VVDPDALDALFAPRTDGSTRNCRDGEVRFAYADREVVVGGDGTVDVRHGSATAEPGLERQSVE